MAFRKLRSNDGRLRIPGKRVISIIALTLWLLVKFDGDTSSYSVRDNDHHGVANKRKLQTAGCYENMATNGDFELDGGSMEGWYTGYDYNTVELVEHDGGYALSVSDRYRTNQGPTQLLTSSGDCLAGEDFYLRVQADVRMFDKDTLEGIATCTNKQHKVWNSQGQYVRAQTECPSVVLQVRRKSLRNLQNFEAHDVNMEWNADTWNVFDIIFKVPELMTGTDITYFCIRFHGGPPNSALQVDNIIVTRIEPSDLPEHPILHFEPGPCDVNSVDNGDGEYESPFGWDAFGHWFAEISIDIVYDEPSSEYAFAAYDRSRPDNTGLSTFVRLECIPGDHYYMRVRANVKLYDQITNEQPIETCAITKEHYCPKVILYIRRDGQKWDRRWFYDNDMILNWQPGEWNPIDMTFAMNPTPEEDPEIRLLLLAFVGGPANSVIEIDKVVVQRLPYVDIPLGSNIFYLDGGVAASSPIKSCRSSGDPHIKTLGGIIFSYHQPGWSTLYEQGDLKVESHQAPWGETDGAVNDAVRVTYTGEVHLFANGTVPTTDIMYFRLRDNILVYPDPIARIHITEFSVGDQHMYEVWISTGEIIDATGVCVDGSVDSVEALEYAAAHQVTFDESAPTYEEAATSCEGVQGTEHYEDCIFDLRMVNDPVLSEVFMEAAVAAVKYDEVEEEQREEFSSGLMSGAITAAVLGDPLIVGLNGQLFKFDGRSDTWYANLATPQLQWNMQFHQFPDCPQDESMYVTGVAFTFFDENHSTEEKPPKHTVLIRVKEKESFSAECNQDSGVCLGNGSIEIVVDGNIIEKPGEHLSKSANDLQIVAYNTFGACSRKHHDFVEQESEDRVDHGRRLDFQKRPLDYLLEAGSNRMNRQVCQEWIRNRVENNDLFLQPGDWTTIHVATPLVSFHVEYRLNKSKAGCPSHSIDAWMSTVSGDMRSQHWQGILGETRQKKNRSDGEQEISDRNFLLSGPKDKDYEVAGPYGTAFPARWLGSGLTWPLPSQHLQGSLRGMQRALSNVFYPR